MINATTQLRRGADGLFRPAQADPQTHAEARAFMDQRELAALANSLIEEVNDQAKDMVSLDNGTSDLNDKQGVVVLGKTPLESRPGDRFTTERSLTLDAETQQPISLERNTSGTMVYVEPSKNWDLGFQTLNDLAHYLIPTASCDMPTRTTFTYQAGPLLDVRLEEVREKKPNSKRHLESSLHLWETAPGEFTINFKDENTLKYVPGRRPEPWGD